jgi:hypothetical protein
MGKIDINLLDKYRNLNSQDKRDLITIVFRINKMFDCEPEGLSKVKSYPIHG